MAMQKLKGEAVAELVVLMCGAEVSREAIVLDLASTTTLSKLRQREMSRGQTQWQAGLSHVHYACFGRRGGV